jgi:hypothetical protein
MRLLAGDAFQGFALDRLPIVAGHGLGRTAQQGLTELGFEFAIRLTLLRVTDQGTNLLAGGGIAFLGDLGFDERDHLVGQRDIHGRHESGPPRLKTVKTVMFGKSCQEGTKSTNAFTRLLRSGAPRPYVFRKRAYNLGGEFVSTMGDR